MGAVLYLIMVAALVVWIRGRKNAAEKGRGSSPQSMAKWLFGPRTNSGDILKDTKGLRRPGENPAGDITCEEQFGHKHTKRGSQQAYDPDRYVSQGDPEEGFIILNGKKMRLKDADKY